MTSNKPLAFGRVREVTEVDNYILMPLSPLDYRTTHFFATIIYDLIKLGYKKEHFEHYFKDFLKDNSLKNILAHVEKHGRMIWEDVSRGLGSKKEIIINIKHGD